MQECYTNDVYVICKISHWLKRERIIFDKTVKPLPMQNFKEKSKRKIKILKRTVSVNGGFELLHYL